MCVSRSRLYPYRPAEEERILAKGGRVFEWGVPRVWLPNADLPGLAMSRSFGDYCASQVGVIADPDVTITDLTPDTWFVILASDGEYETVVGGCGWVCGRQRHDFLLLRTGVWEFISSAQAVAHVAANIHLGPQEAARLLAEEATKRWRMEEDVIDDITCVVLLLDYPTNHEKAEVATPVVEETVPVVSTSDPAAEEAEGEVEGASKEDDKVDLDSVEECATDKPEDAVEGE
jgi:serine/threonine protein phosphatase PrpC